MQAEAKEEEQMQPTEIKSNINNSEKASYWEELLKDRYEVHKIEELNAMGKGKRSRKQVLSHSKIALGSCCNAFSRSATIFCSEGSEFRRDTLLELRLPHKSYDIHALVIYHFQCHCVAPRSFTLKVLHF